MTKWSKLWSKLGAAAVLAALIACVPTLEAPIASTTDENAVPREGGVIRLSSFADTRSLDPANLSDGLAPEMMEALYSGLVDFDEKGNVQPDLAERYELLEDGKTYRFHLRPHVRFHDGTELDAADVVRSIKRALHPSAPNPYTSFFASILG